MIKKIFHLTSKKESAYPKSIKTLFALKRLQIKNILLSALMRLLKSKKKYLMKRLSDAQWIESIRQTERPHYLPDYSYHLDNGSILRIADQYIQDGIPIGDDKVPLNAINWYFYEKRHRSDYFHLHSWQFIDHLIMAYLESKQVKYLDYALAAATDWIDNFIIRAQFSEFVWYDMAVGLRALKLPILMSYAVKHNKLIAAKKLLQAVHVHIIDLSNPYNLTKHSNHGFFQLLGLLVLSKSLPCLKGADPLCKYALYEMTDMLNRSFGKDGLHKEHSPDYNFVFIFYLCHLLQFGWLDKSVYDLNQIKKIIDNSIWLVMPDFKMITLGDSKLVNVRVQLPRDENIVARDSYLSYLYSNGGNNNHPNKKFSWFNDAGLVVVRENWTKNSELLYLSAGFHSRVHKHADDFTFGWFNGTKPAILDTGIYKYVYDDPFRQYVESTRAHNTVEIDQRDYSRFALDAFGSAIENVVALNDIYVIETQLYRKRFFDTHHRRILFYQPRKFLVVVDYLNSPKEHQYTQWFHFHSDFIVTKEGNNFLCVDSHDQYQLKAQTFIVNAELDGISLTKGETTPRVQGWVNVSACNDKLQPAYAVGIHATAKEAGLFTIFSPLDPQPIVTLMNIKTVGKYIRFVLNLEGRKIDLCYKVQGTTRSFSYHDDMNHHQNITKKTQ